MPALLFVAYLAGELGVFVLAVHLIGIAWTLLLMIACSAAGVLLMRSQGRRAMDGLRRAAAGARSPGGAVADGGLVAIGAVLMVVPGLVTSRIGLLLLLPPTRFVIRPLAVAVVRHRFGALAAGPNRAAGFARGTVIDGEVVDESADPGPQPTRLALQPRVREDTGWFDYRG